MLNSELPVYLQIWCYHNPNNPVVIFRRSSIAPFPLKAAGLFELVFISAIFWFTWAFKAAVYEHKVIFPSHRTQLSRDEALHIIKQNVDVYELKTNLASKQGAQIIVFPEYGLYGLNWTRQTITPYLEFIPDPEEVSWNPCADPYRFNNTEVQQQLSCIAKNASIYMVVNFGARQPCNKSKPSCPQDGHFQFSTNLVYDSQGKFIARYFKQNLNSDETYFNKPEKTSYATFSNPFGRFGTFTSYDTMFDDPVITMIRKININNIVYPTAWKDELPLLAAIEFHSAFADDLYINLMAANLHLPSEGYHGSGIYWPIEPPYDKVIYYYNRTLNSTGKLLVHDLYPVRPPPGIISLPSLKRNELVKKSPYSAKEDKLFVKESAVLSTSDQEFVAMMNHDLYTFIATAFTDGDIKVCQNTLCCRVVFEGIFNNTLRSMVYIITIECTTCNPAHL